MLLRIKTQMLLPRQIDEEGLDIDDPRIDLVAQLIEYKKYRSPLITNIKLRGKKTEERRVSNLG